MPDYSKSVIYKIQHLNDDNLLYIGSTTNFTKRKNKHKRDCKTSKSKVYEMIRGNGGWYCFNMIVIKEFPCKNKQELLIEEDNTMREMNSTLNDHRAHLTKEDKLIYEKQYYATHQEKLLKYQKEYNAINQQEISKKAKEYRATHREQINIKNKLYMRKKYEEKKKKKQEEEEKAQQILEELWLCREKEIIRNISIARDIDYDSLMAEFGSKK
jgi:putative cell wall-binding protein